MLTAARYTAINAHICDPDVLVLARIQLIFFTVPSMDLHLGFVLNKMMMKK